VLAVSSDEKLLRLNELDNGNAETVSTSGKGFDAKWKVEGWGCWECFGGFGNCVYALVTPATYASHQWFGGAHGLIDVFSTYHFSIISFVVQAASRYALLTTHVLLLFSYPRYLAIQNSF